MALDTYVMLADYDAVRKLYTDIDSISGGTSRLTLTPSQV